MTVRSMMTNAGSLTKQTTTMIGFVVAEQLCYSVRDPAMTTPPVPTSVTTIRVLSAIACQDTVLFGLGYYMYAMAGFFRQPGHVAVLRSPEYDVRSLKCGTCRLEFWYHMHGSHVGRLEVGFFVIIPKQKDD